MQAKWISGKVIHKNLSTTVPAIEYLKSKELQYRVRKLKTGYKVDVKMWM